MSRFLLYLEAMREHEARRQLRKYRREELDIVTLPDPEFVKNYRVDKTLFESLCQDLVPLLKIKRNRRAIDPVHKILTALNFYARGSYQDQVGQNDNVPMAQQTVSKCLNEVTIALNSPSVVAKYIKFPQVRQERTWIKTRFYNKFGLPGVCGCIDCTHVALIRPVEHEERFFNRKQYHSLNVQVICDADNYILNVDASYGGATHDAFIWNNSEIKRHFETLATQGETSFLLGDSGYPLREYLITPFGSAQEETPQGRFNEVQKKARSIIERTFGILKGRFRCLLAARELHYCPETAGKITIACCLLHNMCVRAEIEVPELTDEERREELLRQPAIPVPAPSNAAHVLQRGRLLRDQLMSSLNRNRRS